MSDTGSLEPVGTYVPTITNVLPDCSDQIGLPPGRLVAFSLPTA
jgi:hypothetical protein